MEEFKIIRKLMGSVFELIISDTDKSRAEELLETGVKEIERLENLLSEFRETSFTSLLNKNAGLQPVTIEKEVFDLIERSVQISNLTQGSFDITVGPLKKLYDFKNGKFVLPDKSAVKKALQVVGYKHISLRENNNVFLKKKGMFISFSAIGKGYAADRVKQIWQILGVEHGVVNAGGDLTVLGKKGNGQEWKIGIADPDNPDKILCYIPIENASVATSGDYEQFFIKNGIRYAHNINPKTGKPVSGIKSVTVISPRAELSDALATAIFVMGVGAGIHLINQLPQTHCLIIDDRNNISHSSNLIFEYAKE
ncbi:FAD:protein FMN transferase [Dyadobacter psychrotolerans]|uniref:FAD:protein FMN transferase n=1 Tax=Dyadobacter psychrotolerans TaxID=2541721 RepID=A0A4R5DF60_9BACT|nr:FAD:protein FMN transferase [Dyadobacter psychrotolerans]TDE12536.1 FAD:protein FMN transferase [Dyadobacter psychrotolerans]